MNVELGSRKWCPERWRAESGFRRRKNEEESALTQRNGNQHLEYR